MSVGARSIVLACLVGAILAGVVRAEDRAQAWNARMDAGKAAIERGDLEEALAQLEAALDLARAEPSDAAALGRTDDAARVRQRLATAP